MRDYNYEYINVHYALIEAFLIKADTNILDISYNVENKKLVIQIVLLEGASFSRKLFNTIRKRLVGFEIEIMDLYLTKEQFNENRGQWTPVNYKWLDYLLFSKAEVL